jgi:hypothetical protein
MLLNYVGEGIILFCVQLRREHGSLIHCFQRYVRMFCSILKEIGDLEKYYLYHTA